MNYFTPTLFVRNQSLDEPVIQEVQREWEERCEKYAEHLLWIRPQLPPGLLYLLDHFHLHDANVRSIGHNGNTFVIVLQIDPAYATLILTYHLTAEARINRSSLPLEYCTTQMDWLYDEVDATAAAPSICTHHILFSNGWEIELHFDDLQVTPLYPLLWSESEQRRVDSALQVVGPYTLPAPRPTPGG